MIFYAAFIALWVAQQFPTTHNFKLTVTSFARPISDLGKSDIKHRLTDIARGNVGLLSDDFYNYSYLVLYAVEDDANFTGANNFWFISNRNDSVITDTANILWLYAAHHTIIADCTLYLFMQMLQML